MDKPRLVINDSLPTGTEIIDDMHMQLGEIFRKAYGTRVPEEAYHIRQWADECDAQFIVALRRILNFDSVIKAVGQVYGVDRQSILSGSRRAYVMPARHHLAWYLRTRGPRVWSLSQIGRFIGKRDHTTIIHSVEVFPNSALDDVKHEVDKRVANHFRTDEFVWKAKNPIEKSAKNDELLIREAPFCLNF